MHVLDIREVTVRRGERLLLDRVSWTVDADQRWVVLGPNGAGKTTLMRICATRMFPTSGTVSVLGETLGRVDIAEIRPLIGWASGELGDDIPFDETVHDVVMTGAWAVTGRWREQYDPQDIARAQQLVQQWGLGSLATRTFGTLSEGERKRTLIARALMSNPELLMLDEPGAGLDLGGREDLVHRLEHLARDEDAPAQIMVTHHVEEIPPGFTHALLIRDGRIVAKGPLRETVTSEQLSATFGAAITVTPLGDRLVAHRAASSA